jgi:hypothetical protein
MVSPTEFRRIEKYIKIWWRWSDLKVWQGMRGWHRRWHDERAVVLLGERAENPTSRRSLRSCVAAVDDDNFIAGEKVFVCVRFGRVSCDCGCALCFRQQKTKAEATHLSPWLARRNNARPTGIFLRDLCYGATWKSVIDYSCWNHSRRKDMHQPVSSSSSRRTSP